MQYTITGWLIGSELSWRDLLANHIIDIKQGHIFQKFRKFEKKKKNVVHAHQNYPQGYWLVIKGSGEASTVGEIWYGDELGPRARVLEAWPCPGICADRSWLVLHSELGIACRNPRGCRPQARIHFCNFLPGTHIINKIFGLKSYYFSVYLSLDRSIFEPLGQSTLATCI